MTSIEEIKHESLGICYRFHLDENTTMIEVIKDLETLEVETHGISFLVLYDDDGHPEAVDFYWVNEMPHLTRG